MAIRSLKKFLTYIILTKILGKLAQLALFRPNQSSRTFYTLAGSILPDLERWSPTHHFIRLLQDKDKLLTNYSQNIDNLESHAGIKPEKLIQCHGSWATATCRKCGYCTSGKSIFAEVRKQEVAKCEKCIQDLKALRPGMMKRKRSSNGSTRKKRRKSFEDSSSEEDYDIPEPGVMKVKERDTGLKKS